MKIVILGLTITSSWGNGHATTYRALVRELTRRGHEVLFLEHDKPWYAANRDMPKPPYGRTRLYSSVEELKDCYGSEIRRADLVLVGSYVPQGVDIGEWVTSTAGCWTAFYDIDTPVTLAKLARGEHEYLSPELIPRFDIYFSFTGGSTLRVLERRYGAQRARVLYCSVDPAVYLPEPAEIRWDCGYLGTYSDDRQPVLDRLLLSVARSWKAGRFVVAGPLYPNSIRWPSNIRHIPHLPPPEHRRFYCSQRFTLNITRADMVRAGFSPSVRLFEAAACATPVISDHWKGLDSVFRIGREILVARSREEAMSFLREMPEKERILIGQRARKRVLRQHTAAHRAAELESHVLELAPKHPVFAIGSRIPSPVTAT